MGFFFFFSMTQSWKYSILIKFKSISKLLPISKMNWWIFLKIFVYVCACMFRYKPKAQLLTFWKQSHSVLDLECEYGSLSNINLTPKQTFYYIDCVKRPNKQSTWLCLSFVNIYNWLLAPFCTVSLKLLIQKHGGFTVGIHCMLPFPIKFWMWIVVKKVIYFWRFDLACTIAL